MNRIGLNCDQASGKERLSPTQVATQLGELHVAICSVFELVQSQCL